MDRGKLIKRDNNVGATWRGGENVGDSRKVVANCVNSALLFFDQ